MFVVYVRSKISHISTGLYVYELTPICPTKKQDNIQKSRQLFPLITWARKDWHNVLDMTPSWIVFLYVCSDVYVKPLAVCRFQRMVYWMK